MTRSKLDVAVAMWDDRLTIDGVSGNSRYAVSLS